MSGSEFEFGQSERLTIRLKGLIRSYPRGIGLLKEFIQNADDATATQLAIAPGSTTFRVDKAKTKGRHEAPFEIRIATPEGVASLRADALIDASGAWFSPNPAGADGLSAISSGSSSCGRGAKFSM